MINTLLANIGIILIVAAVCGACIAWADTDVLDGYD